MISVIKFSNITCVGCDNATLKELSSLRGVFGAQVNWERNSIEVKHTDEINKSEIENKLRAIGYVLAD